MTNSPRSPFYKGGGSDSLPFEKGELERDFENNAAKRVKKRWLN